MQTGIKSASFFLGQWALPPIKEFEDLLTSEPFEPCGPTETLKVGFAPVEEVGSFVISAGGYRAVRVVVETKSVPGSVVKREVERHAQQIEAQQGRKVGKKERRDIKEEVVQSLLPKAFPKTQSIYFLFGKWSDGQTYIVADCASGSKLQEALSFLLSTLNPAGQTVSPQTHSNPALVMSSWLHDESNHYPGVDVGRSVTLKSTDDGGGVISFQNERLMTDEIKKYISEGRVVKELELMIEDRMTIRLTDRLELKKIEFAEAVFDDFGDYEGGLDANITIIGREFDSLLPLLFEVFGGLAQTPTDGMPCAEEGGDMESAEEAEAVE